MVCKRLSIGIKGNNPVLNSLETPSYEEVLNLLSYINEEGSVTWDDLLEQGFSYNDLVWLANSYAIDTIGGMDPTIVVREHGSYSRKFYEHEVKTIQSEFERY